MIHTKNEIISLMIPIIEKYPVKRVAIFGSYVRDEQTATSDIDLCFELGTNNAYPGVYYIYDLLDDIELATKKKVDYITTSGLRTCPNEKLKTNILEEGFWFYEV